jgi:DNA-binding response OmpR family regulator
MEKILHVDDSQDILNIYNEILTSEYLVTSLSNSKDLQSKLSESIYDAILLDIRMPEISGADAIKIIRDDSNNKNTNIFILSADDSSSTTVEFLKEGIADYLNKNIESRGNYCSY